MTRNFPHLRSVKKAFGINDQVVPVVLFGSAGKHWPTQQHRNRTARQQPPPAPRRPHPRRSMCWVSPRRSRSGICGVIVFPPEAHQEIVRVGRRDHPVDLQGIGIRRRRNIFQTSCGIYTPVQVAERQHAATNVRDHTIAKVMRHPRRAVKHKVSSEPTGWISGTLARYAPVPASPVQRAEPL